MKLEKLNKERIALTNEMMSSVVGGTKPGDTRYAYSGGTADDYNAGKPSTDRTIEVYTFDPDCNCLGWENTGHGSSRADTQNIMVPR